MPVFLPWLIAAGVGLAATGAGLAINRGLEKDAEKRANRAFLKLEQDQQKFRDEKNAKKRELTEKFGSEERETELQTAKEDIGGVLAQTATRGRDDSALVDKPVGDVSTQFIDRRADIDEDLTERLGRKTENLANVLAVGGANFQEKDFVRRGAQSLDTVNSLQRGNLSANERKVNAEALVEHSLLADILTTVGPVVASAGIGGILAAPAAGVAGTASATSTGFLGAVPAGQAFFSSSIPSLASIQPLQGIGSALAGSATPAVVNHKRFF